MHIRVQWNAAGMFLVLAVIAGAASGLAGFFSFWLSFFLPLYAVCALVYLGVSWSFYTWNQSFSTNHPQKGENVAFRITLVNDSRLPLIGGSCSFVMPGIQKQITLPSGGFTKKHSTHVYETSIACPYRGTYIAGMERIVLTSPLGIVATEIQIQPQTFYVYPELCPLTESLERHALSSGPVLPGSVRGDADVSVFEYVAPLRSEQHGARIAWKRWAATGIPAAVINGHTRSRGVSVILDLFPCGTLPEVSDMQRLAAEDVVISAAFSVVNYLAQHHIPVIFIAGDRSSALNIDSPGAFEHLYERSSRIQFDDSSFPAAAFSDGDDTPLLFSTRPFNELYQEYDKALQKGCEPGVFLCPPEPYLNQELHSTAGVREQRINADCRTLFFIADVTKGSTEIPHAFNS